MKESYSEGVANHTDPESCGVTRKGGAEALAGAHAESGMEPRKTNFRVLTLSRQAAARPGASITREAHGPGAVGDPVRAWKHLAREPGDPGVAHSRKVGPIGKSKDVRR